MPKLKKNPDILGFTFTALNTGKMLSFSSYFWSFSIVGREARRHTAWWCDVWSYLPQFSSVQLQSLPTLCNPMDHSTLGLPVHHQLLEFTQTHVHWVGDAIQPSHPLSSPSPPAPNPSPASESFPISQLFTWGGQSTGASASASIEYSGLISFRMD